MSLESLNVLRVPDLWQQKAIRHLQAGHDVVIDAPTGSGKTYVFENIIESRVIKGQAVYTVPTRALANDKLLEWRAKGWDVGIVTGDVTENAEAPVIVATLETQRDRMIEGNGPALLVVDEYQMLSDSVRGSSYELVIALAPEETQLMLLSGSVANPEDVVDWLTRLDRQAKLVVTKERPVPLEEMPLEALPIKAPAHVTGYWPRLACEVLMANLGPLLIFAPRRSQAEKIAKQIAAVLPADDPLNLSDKQKQVCGDELSRVLEKRVCWHHSGLSFQQRAGVIEPLAKAGKLRVIVATMGLAAGINFSVRSVMVSDTRYFDGRYDREVRRDELLQMFGRAGRRGFDRTGFVISNSHSPHISDAAQARLRRGQDLDWPTLLRIMEVASSNGHDAFAAAQALSHTLFSKQKIDFGLDASSASPEDLEEQKRDIFNLGPTRIEIFNAKGAWEKKVPEREVKIHLRKTFVYHNQYLEPALENYYVISNLIKIGRVCRLARNDRRYYGKEIALAIQNADGHEYSLTRNVRSWLGIKGHPSYTLSQIETQIIPQLEPFLEGGSVAKIVQRGEILALQLDFARVTVNAYQDSNGCYLIEPDEREVPIEASTYLINPETGEEVQPRQSSVAYAWRKLGLIEPDGRPTMRGMITSYFQHGEGLAVAAALEDTSLAIDELLPLLANLRAGNRFTESAIGAADRLSHACRTVYGTADHDGYLHLGLPIGYGEGAAPYIEELLHGKTNQRRLASDQVGEGDIERVFIEWLSLLRHITHCPDYEWDRWMELKNLAAATLQAHEKKMPSRVLPEIPAGQLTHQTDHHLNPAKLKK